MSEIRGGREREKQEQGEGKEQEVEKNILRARKKQN